MKLLQPVNITPEEMGEDIAKLIPGQDPELHISNTAKPINRIPVREEDDSPRIIPVCEPTLVGNERKYVNECLDTNWISSAGRFITAFEALFAAECDTQYGVALREWYGGFASGPGRYGYWSGR